MPSYAKDATARLFLEPSQYEGPLYWCDDNISGYLALTTDSVFYTRSITVSLQALQLVQVKNKQGTTSSPDSSDVYVLAYFVYLFYNDTSNLLLRFSRLGSLEIDWKPKIEIEISHEANRNPNIFGLI